MNTYRKERFLKKKNDMTKKEKCNTIKLTLFFHLCRVFWKLLKFGDPSYQQKKRRKLKSNDLVSGTDLIWFDSLISSILYVRLQYFDLLMVLKKIITILNRKSQKPFWAFRGDSLSVYTNLIIWWHRRFWLGNKVLHHQYYIGAFIEYINEILQLLIANYRPVFKPCSEKFKGPHGNAEKKYRIFFFF